jgi:hypothetical protein
LHPGTYSCGTAIMSGFESLDVVPNCATWEVTSAMAIDRGFSGCRLPVSVTVETVAKKPSFDNEGSMKRG